MAAHSNAKTTSLRDRRNDIYQCRRGRGRCWDLSRHSIVVSVVTKLREERTLEPGESTQFGAPFNAITGRPRLDVMIEVPSHVRSRLEKEEALLGKREEPAKAYKVFRVKNKCSWAAYVRFVKYIDG
jgi:hypothetical protein